MPEKASKTDKLARFPEFQRFVKERMYLQNVSAATIRWYTYSLWALGTETPTDQDLKDFVIRMRQKGLKATGCNCRIRAVNAYLHWASGNPSPKCGSGCNHPKIAKLKEPSVVLPTYSDDDLKRLIVWKPKRKSHKRAHLLILTLIDTGARINELLSLKWPQIDFDNLLMTLDGKGAKQRIIPFSIELRAALYRWKQSKLSIQYVFSTHSGTTMNHRNAMRDVSIACERVGIEAPERLLHAFRHTFGLNYIRRGGSVFHLQRVLGHTTLDMTRRYVNLQTEDLQKVHKQTSMLSSLRC